MSRAEIKGRMSMDAKGVRVGVDGAKKSVDGFGKQLGHLKGLMATAFSVGAVAAAGRSIANLGGEISDFAFQTSMSTDAFQAFNSVAMDGGASMQAVQKGLISIRDAQFAALNGEQMYQEAFEELGITLDHIAEYSMQELLQAVAEGAKETGNFGSVVDIVGKRNAASLEEALYVLADEGFPALIKAAKEAGDVIDEEMVAKLDAAADRLDKFSLKAKVAGSLFGNKIVRGYDFWGKTIKNAFDPKNATPEFDPFTNWKNAAIQAVQEIEAADAEAIEKAAEKREKTTERESEQREKLIKKIYAKEAEEAAKVEEKKTATLKKPTLKLSRFEAADSLAQIGGKVGGQADNVDRRLSEIKLYTEQSAAYLEQIAAQEAGGTLKVVNG